MKAILLGIVLGLISTSILFAQNVEPGQFAPTSSRASFDCSKARSGAARLICSDPALSEADRELGEAYRKALGHLEAAAKQTLQDEQVKWIKERNTRCGLDAKDGASVSELRHSTDCMMDALLDRKKRLLNVKQAFASIPVPQLSKTVTTAPQVSSSPEKNIPRLQHSFEAVPNAVGVPSAAVSPSAAPVSAVTQAAAFQTSNSGQIEKEGTMIFQNGIMVGIFILMVHAALLFAAFGMFYLLLRVIFRFSYHEHEKLMRSLAAAAGLLIYVGSKSLGVSIPGLMFESLETTVPISVGLLGVAIPSMGGLLIAWYVVRFLNSADAVRNVVGMRVLSLVMTFVFFLYCDSYVATYGKEKSPELVYLLPNLTFVLSVLLYSIFKYHPEGTARIHREEEVRALPIQANYEELQDGPQAYEAPPDWIPRR